MWTGRRGTLFQFDCHSIFLVIGRGDCEVLRIFHDNLEAFSFITLILIGVVEGILLQSCVENLCLNLIFFLFQTITSVALLFLPRKIRLECFLGDVCFVSCQQIKYSAF